MSSQRPLCQIYTHEIDLMAGFSEDVSNLVEKVVERFVRFNSLRFKYFTNVWQEMAFSLIFNGRKMFRELWEFTECALRVVKEMFLKTSETFEKVATFFLLYGLYFKQPIRPQVWTQVMPKHGVIYVEKHFLQGDDRIVHCPWSHNGKNNKDLKLVVTI